MNRFRTRTSATTARLAVGVIAAAVTLAGCSAGQVSQMAMQQPAVNGTGATVGTIDLRNVHLRAPQTGDFIQPGTDVELLFVAVNGSPADGDRLVSVTSDRSVKVLAFLTSESLAALGAADHVTVYMPQSYGLAGHILVVPSSHVQRIDADAAEVMAFIISGGVTQVEQKTLKVP